MLAATDPGADACSDRAAYRPPDLLAHGPAHHTADHGEAGRLSTVWPIDMAHISTVNDSGLGDRNYGPPSLIRPASSYDHRQMPSVRPTTMPSALPTTPPTARPTLVPSTAPTVLPAVMPSRAQRLQ